MQSVSSARFVTPPLTKRKRELLGELLDQFAESVNFCIQRCLEHGLTSRASLHREAEPKPAEGICGIDIDERSVDLCILKPNERPKHIKLDTSKLAFIAHVMELKQKTIQEKLATQGEVLPTQAQPRHPDSVCMRKLPRYPPRSNARADPRHN